MPSHFEDEFQKFVADGGLDQVDGIVNEDYERTRQSIMCGHGRLWKDCVICYRPPKPYMPGESS